MRSTKIVWIMVCLVILMSVSASMSSQDSQTKKFKIVMVLWRGITDSEKGFMDYIKNRNLSVEFIIKNCDNNKNLLPQFIKEIRDIKPDLIYAFGTTVTRTIAGSHKNHSPDQFITDIPVVFSIVADPLGAEIVPTLESSERNVTGVSHLVPYPTQIKAMKSYLQFNRLGIIYNPEEKNSLLAVKALEELTTDNDFTLLKVPILPDNKKEADKTKARNLTTYDVSKKKYEDQIKLLDQSMKKIQSLMTKYQDTMTKEQANINKSRSAKIRYERAQKRFQIDNQKHEHLAEAKKLLEAKIKDIGLKRFADAIADLVAKKPQLIYLPSDSFIISNSSILIPEINKYKIPTFSATEGPIRNDGALFGLVSRYYSVGKFAGYKAEQILVHKKDPKNIPVETLKRFSFLIHVDTAKQLELYPPITILKFAEIISAKALAKKSN